MSDDFDKFVASVKNSNTDGSIMPTTIGPKFNIYTIGIGAASACTNLSDSDAEVAINRQYPTGIRTPWKISKDKTFSGGEPNPCPCPDDNSCRHILFNC